jgi:hypothetical protein
MFDTIFGSKSAERVLVYINAREGGYGRGIATFYGGSLTSVHKQLEKFENANILFGEQQGRTRIYRLNPRYALYKEDIPVVLVGGACVNIYSGNEYQNRIHRKKPLL